ncbi:MAG: glycosyltransferase family 2 protein [Alphaproteobacteria bacterium]|nr:glycosyltransferase family 2 protein [Alphaproteobacteria bacterium]
MYKKIVSSKLIILMPYFDDQPSLEILIPKLLNNVEEFHLVVIDDGSIYHPLTQKELKLLHPNVTLLKLKRNSGVQRALALGLLYIEDNFDYEHVLIMDSDGEDSPESVPYLLDKSLENPMGGADILVASRLSRQNSIAFQIMWRVYKLLFRFLTGKTMDFGNFSLLSRKATQHLIHFPQIWIHLGSSYLLSGLKIDAIKLSRGKRYRGKSKMNVTALINHGLRSFVALSEFVIPRVFFISSFYFGLSIVFLFFGHLSGISWFKDLAVIVFFLLCFSLLQLNLVLFLSVSRSPIEYHGGNYLNLITEPADS